MSYLVEQKAKHHTYVYEATNVWNAELKQARQTRRYLGKKDPETGKLIPAKKRVVMIEETPGESKGGISEGRLSDAVSGLPGAVCKTEDEIRGSAGEGVLEDVPMGSSYEYGPLYLLEQLAQSCGVKQALEAAFESTLAQQLLSLAFFQLLESKAFHLYATWQQTVGSEFVVPLSSQRISEVLAVLGRSDIQRLVFFQRLTQCHRPLRGVWIDISSLSSYSGQNAFVEWGYNRDGESLPQVNLGILMGYPANLPLYYHVYPGSIPDVSTLKNLSLTASDLGIPLETWVMDRGFFSTANVQHMIQEGFCFITMLPKRLLECAR